MTPYIQLHDRVFHQIISAEEIEERVKVLGREISKKYAGKTPLFLSVLTGSFMFATDLMRNIKIPCEITFIKAKSYDGIRSTGEVLLGELDTSVLSDRHIIIVEDIVDTGLTISSLLLKLEEANAASIAIATALFKPGNLKTPLEISYVAFEIPNEFVVGYGIDYDGLGRNLPAIYQEGK